MARQILFTSRKGGVGKSTLARATAIALAAEGRKVLLADFDVDSSVSIASRIVMTTWCWIPPGSRRR